MESVFPFGCRYDAAAIPPKEWEQDMKLMRYLRFNTVRIPLVWGRMEPVRLWVDYAFLDRVLELAEAYSLRVIFSFCFRGAPEWACRKHPSYWYMDSFGRYIPPSSSPEVPSGGWPGLCPDHTEVRNMEARFIRTVCTHVGNRAWGWDPSGESQGIAVPGTSGVSGLTCYCPSTCRHFREWALKKYGTVQEISRAWNMVLDDNEAIRPPAGRSGIVQFSDWRTFTAERIAGAAARRSEVIRSAAEGKILSGSPEGGCISFSDIGAHPSDDWESTVGCDQWGVSCSLSGPKDTVHASLIMAGARSAAQGREFWQSGLGTGKSQGGISAGPVIGPKLLTNWCWEILMSGAHGFLFDSFRKIRSGAGCGSPSLTDGNGNLLDRAYAAQKVGHILEDYSYTFMSGRPSKAETAILYSPSSRLLEYSEQGNSFFTSSSLKGFASALRDGSIPYDVIHEDHILPEELSKYRFLILPAALTLPERFTSMLENFVREGGTILADPALCLWDNDGLYARKLPGNGLHLLFGGEGVDSPSSAPVTVPLRRGGSLYEIAGVRFLQKWKNISAGVWAEYADGTPAILMKPLGKGRTILTGVNLGNPALFCLGTNKYNTAAELIRKFAFLAGAEPPVKVPPSLRSALLNAKHADIIMLSDAAGNGGKFTIAYPAGTGKRWTSVTSREKGVFTDGTAELEFFPGETKVLFTEK